MTKVSTRSVKVRRGSASPPLRWGEEIVYSHVKTWVSRFDSDTILITDNKLLIEAAQKNCGVYKVPTNCVRAQKVRRHYKALDKADLDVKTSVNKIGEIVNLSQQLNSLYWEKLNHGETATDNEELYNDICKLAVLSGIEIDKAKKEFTIDSGREIEILKSKYRLEENGRTTKPMFFKMITTENGYELPPDTSYRYFDTSMDYLQKILQKTNYRQARQLNKDTIPLMDIIHKPTTNVRSGKYNIIRDHIIEMLKTYKATIAGIYFGFEGKTVDEKNRVVMDASFIKDQCLKTISKMSSHQYLMWLILKEVEKKENRSIRTLMFETMFGKPDETFMKMVNESKEPIYTLVEDPEGTEKYYGFTYKRITSFR